MVCYFYYTTDQKTLVMKDRGFPAYHAIYIALYYTKMIIWIPYGEHMELKTARLTVLVDPAKKKAFETLCARQDVTPSQVVRRLIRDYLVHHGVSFVPSGLDQEDDSASKA